MSYETLLEKISELPEDCFDEIFDYINYVLYKHNKSAKKTAEMSKYFGSVKFSQDGLEIQKKLRNEWD